MNPKEKRSLVVMLASLTGVGVVGALLIMQVNAGEMAAGPKPPEPATVTAAVKESDLNLITLKPEAADRIGLKVVAVEKRKVSRRQTFGGEVVIPPGHAVVVSAPIAGTLQLPKASTTQPTQPTTRPTELTPGSAVGAGDTVFVLVPLLTAEARANIAALLAEAEGLVNNSDVQLKAAEVARDRARQLMSDKAGSQRAVDEAQAQYDMAVQTAEAAKNRRDVLASTARGAQDGSVDLLKIVSPTNGVLQNLHVAPGQLVSAGAALFDVADVSKVWIRVPVYAGEAVEAATDQPVKVSRLGTRNSPGPSTQPAATIEAQPAHAPPTATALTSTVDLMYAMPNATPPLRPGERVAVSVPIRGDVESLVVPWGAVVFDVHGGTWVYVETVPLQYARQRVEVRYVAGGDAVLASGPAVGAKVVSVGAAELFGREMGFAK